MVEVVKRKLTRSVQCGSGLEPFTVDWKLAGNEEEILRLGERTVRAIPIPGCSPGSVAYVTNPAVLCFANLAGYFNRLHTRLYEFAIRHDRLPAGVPVAVHHIQKMVAVLMAERFWYRNSLSVSR